MGSFFSNISIIKETTNVDSIKKYLIQHMKKSGFIPAKTGSEDTSQTLIIRINPNSKWFTIYCNDSDDGQMNQMAAYLAKKLKSYVMSISNVDSDFMIIHLYNHNSVDTVIVGHPYDTDMDEAEMENAHGKTESWHPLAKNVDRLIESFSQDYVCSEEVLETMEEEIGICYEDIHIQFSDIQESPIISTPLQFKSVNKKNETMALPGPSFQCIQCTYLKPGEIHTSWFINRGAQSKGVTVTISGDLINSQAISIQEISISCFRYPFNNIMQQYERIVERAAATYSNSADGILELRATFPDFPILYGFSPIYDGDKPSDVLDLERRMSMRVQFLPVGIWPAGKEHDLVIKVQPNEDEWGYGIAHTWTN